MIPSMYVSAEMLITTEYGFMGQGKEDVPIAVTITIENDDQPFEGDLVTTYPNNYTLQTAQVIPLKLDANEKVTKKIYLNNYPYELYENPEKPFLYLYEGEIEKGKQYSNYRVENSKPHLYSYHTHFVGVINQEGVVNALLPFRSMGGGSLVEVKNYTIDELTNISDARDLSLIDIIVLPTTSNRLNDQQLKILVDWMNDGGQLIVDEELSAKMFNDFAALQFVEGNSIVSSVQLQQFSNEYTFDDTITVRNSRLHANAQSYSVDDLILAAKQKVGKGAFIQTAFSLTDPSFMQSEGYSRLLAQFVDFDMPMYPTTALNELTNTLVPVNELFPTFEFSLWKIITVFILYILLISPVLYIVLKKKDKREYAWWLIPVISIVFSITLFLIGAKDRIAQPQIQQSAVIKVGEESQQYFVQSLLSNRNGDYQFDLSQEMDVFVYGNDRVELKDFEKGRFSYITNKENMKKLTLKNVPYWDVESIVGQGPIEIGKFKVDLVNESGYLAGTIRNEFGVDMQNLEIWTGRQLIELGSIKDGEVREVREKINTTLLLPAVLSNGLSYETPTPSTIEKQRQERLLAMAQMVLENNQSPAIIAKANGLDVGAKLTRDAFVTTDVLIVQPFTAPAHLTEALLIENEAFYTTFTSEMYGGMKEQLSPNLGDWYFDPGEYNVTYRLPQQLINEEVNWESLQYVVDSRVINPQIYNQQLQQFESISNEFKTNNVKDYIAHNEIHFKWTVLEGIYENPKALPKIQLKGAVASD